MSSNVKEVPKRRMVLVWLTVEAALAVWGIAPAGGGVK